VYLVLDGKSAGPFTLDQVRRMWVDGKINAETLFFRDGQTEWQPLQQIVPELFPADAAHTANVIHAMPGPERPPAAWIAGFWRRIGAIVVDAILLGILGSILGAIFFDLFAQMGAEGKLVGLVILLAYFGLQESALAGGQTLGKRLLGIRVVGRDGNCLSIPKSMARTAIWVVPWLLNGLPISGPMWLLAVLGLSLFSFFFAAVYLLIFNRRTRQTVYDLLTDSYVVRSATPGVVDQLPVWKWHYAIIGGWCGLWIVLISLLAFSGIFKGFLADLLDLQQKVEALPDVQYASVNKGVMYMSGQAGATTTVTVRVTYSHKITDEDKAARDVAAVVLADRDAIGNPNELDISVGRSFDIGIASGRYFNSTSHSPDEWDDIVKKGR
jgi:uncharacterized RDD family membrane protein YckC